MEAAKVLLFVVLFAAIAGLGGWVFGWTMAQFTVGAFTFKKAKVRWRQGTYDIFFKVKKNVSIKFGGKRDVSYSYELKDSFMRFRCFREVDVSTDENGKVTHVGIYGVFRDNQINPESWLQKLVLEVEPISYEMAYDMCRSMTQDEEKRKKVEVLVYPERQVFQAIINQLPKP